MWVAVPWRANSNTVRLMGRILLIVGAASLAITALAEAPSGFRWNSHDSQELSARQSLRNSALSKQDKDAISAAIEDQLTEVMPDPEVESESRLRKAALDTRIKMIDLNGDGVPEVVAQGMADCSPTGNCSVWILQRKPDGYKVLLAAFGQTFTIQQTSTNGYRNVVVSMHGSATQSGLTEYRYRGGRYREAGCYSAEWTVRDNDGTIRELKEPRITPCDSP
jgi:hypothetical protein